MLSYLRITLMVLVSIFGIMMGLVLLNSSIDLIAGRYGAGDEVVIFGVATLGSVDIYYAVKFYMPKK